MLERLGGFDENLNGLEDWDMWLRCVRVGAQVTVLNERGCGKNSSYVNEYESSQDEFANLNSV